MFDFISDSNSWRKYKRIERLSSIVEALPLSDYRRKSFRFSIQCRAIIVRNVIALETERKKQLIIHVSSLRESIKHL